MSTIRDIHLPFRDSWLPASYRGAPFFVEATSRDNGRRIVTHEFPKKDFPYSEDMGRKAKTFTLRAYCITYPVTLDGDNGVLYNKDYRVVRDKLIQALEAYGPGTLVLSTLPQENVVVTRYRITEEEKFGGYCTFDIEFVEAGVRPLVSTNPQNTRAVLNAAADALRAAAAAGMDISQANATKEGLEEAWKKFGRW
jgi:prophage DNA circulation protein